MTRRMAQAVIGAGYGDEGKGLMVDALAAAAAERPVVVRTNGGAQAGHTVETPDGRRHVFHHFGSGALAGAATHLSRFFVHHPMLFGAERAELQALGAELEVSADDRGLVTTPYDMLVNQAVERARGAARHGSCGLGFGETVERGASPFRLTLADLAAPDLRVQLEAVRRTWVPARLQALGLSVLPAETARVLEDDAVLDVFLEDCRRMLDVVALRPDAKLGDAAAPVIFEGAQGLLLDPSIGAFPHVTRSHTGLVQMAAVAHEAGLDGISAVYVTRAYATRHGSGPLPGARARLEGFRVVDPTNAPNAWQGAIRHAPLHLGELARAVAADLRLADVGFLRVERALAVTCLDQALGPVEVLDLGGRPRLVPADVLPAVLGRRLALPVAARSFGPSRTAVELGKAEPGLAA